ncbi:FxsA family protein [Aliiroseovarius subalbicans]|uniref:FxsA family protein n=1 Tax=Aliiroseovarius subalbicans TaxID=2925840 RepID=UPI001F58C091|nr:FxsA family protein [Aliiroseovarius subalbicans]MCI2400075.1 FxsA family protein [Aliiroseovarius subalbicans]
MWLFALFVAVPLIEIGLFIQVGGAIGLWPTLAIVVVTAILGTSLVRAQGAMAMGQLRDSFNQLNDPTEPLAHGAMILFSGALLLTPGFFTDAVGFALLIPPVRRAVFKYFAARVKVQSFTMGAEMHQRAPQGEDVIDGDFTDVTPEKKPTHPGVQGPSGWTKH